jgi:4-diphosphocytidyl-2-C-methyl-D-erythritol kinase
LYSHITAEQYTRGEHIASLLENLGNGNSICNPSIFNVFESLAKRVFPGLSEYIHIFEEIAGTEVHLAGSGPTLFTLVQSEDQSFRICNSLIQRGLKAHVATTIPRA